MSSGFTASSARYAALLGEAKRATHAVDGALLDRTDLANLVDRLRQAVEDLVAERDRWLAERTQLSGRLTRSSHLPKHQSSDDSGVFTFSTAPSRSELRNNDGASLAAPPHAAGGDSGLGPMS